MPRQKVTLDPAENDGLSDVELALWRQAATSFENGEYSEALPAWQELAASGRDLEGWYHETSGATTQAQLSAAFNLARTYEQVGA